MSAAGGSGGRLEEKTAIVTGAAQGLGGSIAELLAREGAGVLVTDIQDELGQEKVEQITAAGGRAVYQHLDASSEEDWAAALERCEAELGAPDVLVNNVYKWAPGTILDTEPDDFRASIELNLTAAYLGMRAVLPVMQRLGHGAIVNIGSSLGGEIGAPDFASYQAAKGGVYSLTRHVAVTYAKDGIRANLVHPGPMRTEGMDAAGFIPAMEQIASSFPIARVAEPEEVAWSAVFLASDESSYITGTAIAADGGSSMTL